MIYEAQQYSACSKQSVMTEVEFQLVGAFLSAVREKRYHEAIRLHAHELWSMMDEYGRRESMEIIHQLCDDCGEHLTAEAIADIRVAEGSDIEKRQKLFELYNNLVRKNKLKWEDL